MNKPPAFLFYAKDFLTSKAVLSMTPAQIGHYILLLAHAWDSDNPGHLDNDPDVLWKLARARSRKAFDRVAPLVLQQFKSMADGSIANERLVLERRAQVRRSKEKSAAAKARWVNKNQASALHPQCLSSSFAFASAVAPKDLNAIGTQKPRAARATVWPEGFRLTEELAEYARGKGMQDSASEWEAFENHHRSKGTKFADWRRAWFNWVLRAPKFERRPSLRNAINPESQVGRGPEDSGAHMSEAARERLERRQAEQCQ